MSFIYSVIGDNTPENREHLEKVGWKSKYVQEGADTIVTASNTAMFSIIEANSQDWFYEYLPYCIDCRNNPALFRAVTAMRDDSDKWQLFTDGIKWTLCYEESILMWRDIFNFPDKNLIHKASLAELQEYFK